MDAKNDTEDSSGGTIYERWFEHGRYILCIKVDFYLIQIATR